MGNVWLFQANPDDYDLRIEIKNGKVDDWTWHRYEEHLDKDDTVILWHSGPNAGIYGFGKLGAMKGTDRIFIKYTERLDQPLMKTQLMDDPVLCELQVIKNYFQANPFRVTAAEWKAIKGLLIPIA